MLSSTSEYALRAIVFLASNDGQTNTRDVIASATQVPNDYLIKVLKSMEDAGFVTIKRGPGGGYALAMAPEEINVYDIVSVVSEVPRIKSCPLGIDEHVKLCPLHQRLDDAAAQVERAFRDTTIAELVPSRRNRTSCQFPCEP